MRRFARACGFVFAALAVTRAVAFLVYAMCRWTLPGEVWYLEPKLVLLCWRVREGLPWYPRWTEYPHVSNFFGPVYFGLVGLVGRAFGLDLPGLTILGRSLTLGCGLGTSLVLGMYAARRLGWKRGVVVGALTLGSTAMIGFGLMVRPDTMANILATIGLILAIEGRGRRFLLASFPMVLAILTKQTALLMLVAACAAMVVQRRILAATALMTLVVVPVVVIVAGVTLTVEPMFAFSLMGESSTPWTLSGWRQLIGKLVSQSPDLMVLPVVGIVLARLREPRRNGWTAAAIILITGDLVAVAKYGADLNYFLDLRVVQAWAACMLWSAMPHVEDETPGWPLAALGLAATLSLVPGTALGLLEARDAIALARFETTAEGKAFRASLRELEALVADPSMRVLTDSAYLQSFKKGRAEFGDPWLFRMQVDAGLVEPSRMERLLESGCYDRLVTFRDLFAPRDPADVNSLPRGLIYRARDRYKLLERKAGLFVYERSRPPDADCPP